MLPFVVFILFAIKSLFELIHCYVWSPTRTPSVSGYRYYIVFIDDFSRVSWIYLLKDRVCVLDTVKIFFTEIMNQYSVTPKVLRTNNALEFTQMNLQSYYESLGVIHQTSCLHTSQQNGVRLSVNIDIFLM